MSGLRTVLVVAWAVVVVAAVPILHVPIVALLAVPVAFPALLAYAATPLLVVRPEVGWVRTAAGGALLALGGVLASALVVHGITRAGLVSRSVADGFLDRPTLGLAASTFGVLVAGAGVARGGGLARDLAWSAGYLVVALAAAATLSMWAALGLPMGT